MADQTESGTATSPNPYVGKHAVPGPVEPTLPVKKRGKNRKTTSVSGNKLVPTLSKHKPGVAQEHFYWIGITPDCPVEYITCAGLCFPKVNENLIPDPMRSNTKARVPVIGALVKITAAKMQLLIERLPRVVIRYTDKKANEEPGEISSSQRLSDNNTAPRRGQLITIPTDEQVALASKKGRHSKQYVPQASDRPAASFMFVQLCDNQSTGSRGDYYPDTVDVMGLEWPGEL